MKVLILLAFLALFLFVGKKLFVVRDGGKQPQYKGNRPGGIDMSDTIKICERIIEKLGGPMVVTKTEECPECEKDVEVEIAVNIDIETAAHELIAYYKGKDVSVGDAKKLEDAIRKCLVDELGVSSSKVE